MPNQVSACRFLSASPVFGGQLEETDRGRWYACQRCITICFCRNFLSSSEGSAGKLSPNDKASFQNCAKNSPRLRDSEPYAEPIPFIVPYNRSFFGRPRQKAVGSMASLRSSSAILRSSRYFCSKNFLHKLKECDYFFGKIVIIY